MEVKHGEFSRRGLLPTSPGMATAAFTSGAAASIAGISNRMLSSKAGTIYGAAYSMLPQRSLWI
jgi:hypothetical protein